MVFVIVVENVTFKKNSILFLLFYFCVLKCIVHEYLYFRGFGFQTTFIVSQAKVILMWHSFQNKFLYTIELL